MLVLLVIHNDRECTPQPFLLKPIRDRGLVSNLQLFHRTPPFPHCAGIEQERRNLTTSVYFAATSSPAYEPPGQSFYRLRLPHRRDLSAAQARVWLGGLFVPKTTSAVGTFTLRIVRACVHSTDGLCTGADDLRVPAVVIFALSPAKSFGPTGVCSGCVISEALSRLTVAASHREWAHPAAPTRRRANGQHADELPSLPLRSPWRAGWHIKAFD
jgi:hypothetical protein